MCFIWNKSRKIENGDHKVEYCRGIWTGMGMDKTCGVVREAMGKGVIAKGGRD